MHKRAIFGGDQLMTDLYYTYATSDSSEKSNWVGERLSQDPRFAYNTLSFVFEYLDTFSLIRCGQVCKLWHDVTYDCRLWRCIELYRCKVNFPKMVSAFKDRKITGLKIVDCKLKKQGSKDNLFDFIGSREGLRVVEVSDCTSKLIEMLPGDNLYLESIRASLMCGSTGLKLDLNFIFLLPRLYEIKLYCNRELENFYGLFNNLGHLRHVYLLGVKNLDLRLLHTLEVPKSCMLESLGLGDCQFLGNSIAIFLKALPLLKKLRLERCSDWQAFVILEGISKCPRLEVLELLEFNITKQFDIGLRLCTNLKELTVIPNAHRFEMAAFNARLFRGACGLKRTLRKFTWGFSKKYMDYLFRMYNTVDSVPFVDGDENSNATSLISLRELEDRLKFTMTDTEILITTSIVAGDVFSVRY